MPTRRSESKKPTLTILQPTAVLFTLSLWLGLPACAHAEDLPEFSAHYKVSRGIVTLAKTHRSLKKIDADHYLFESVSRPTGVGKIITEAEVQERSRWILHDNIPRPLEYTYLSDGGESRRDVKLVFDWANKTVTNIVNGDPWTMDLVLETQDKLLYQLKLMLDLIKGKRHLEYLVADGGTLKTYTAHIVGKEIVKTDIGNFDTLKIVRDYPDGRRTTLWCPPNMYFIPVQIEQSKKDGGLAKALIYKIEGVKIPASVPVDW